MINSIARRILSITRITVELFSNVHYYKEDPFLLSICPENGTNHMYRLIDIYHDLFIDQSKVSTSTISCNTFSHGGHYKYSRRWEHNYGKNDWKMECVGFTFVVVTAWEYFWFDLSCNLHMTTATSKHLTRQKWQLGTVSVPFNSILNSKILTRLVVTFPVQHYWVLIFAISLFLLFTLSAIIEYPTHFLLGRLQLLHFFFFFHSITVNYTVQVLCTVSLWNFNFWCLLPARSIFYYSA